MLTSSDGETDVFKSYDLCANTYLTKPVEPSNSVDIVRSIE